MGLQGDMFPWVCAPRRFSLLNPRPLRHLRIRQSTCFDGPNLVLVLCCPSYESLCGPPSSTARGTSVSKQLSPPGRLNTAMSLCRPWKQGQLLLFWPLLLFPFLCEFEFFSHIAHFPVVLSSPHPQYALTQPSTRLPGDIWPLCRAGCWVWCLTFPKRTAVCPIDISPLLTMSSSFFPDATPTSRLECMYLGALSIANL